MSKGEALRALVIKRLAAAAEDIFVLFERAMAEYEEELRRSKEKNQRKQQLLDSALSPRTDLVCGNVQTALPSPGPGLIQEMTQAQWIKEEPEELSVKQEEEQLRIPAPESSSVCVKTEESSLLQQKPDEHREEAEEKDRLEDSLEPHFHSETGPEFSFSVANMETEADGGCYSQVQISDELCLQNNPALESSVPSGQASGAEGRRHHCPLCAKQFGTKQILRRHIRVHTGEKPHSCSICRKTFTQHGALESHMRTHTGEKPYSCSLCEKTFAHRSGLTFHLQAHACEEQYSCSTCMKRFTSQASLLRHKISHMRDKAFECSICKKTFSQKVHRDAHIRTHTGEKPYSCSYCGKSFGQRSSLNRHTRIHLKQRP